MMSYESPCPSVESEDAVYPFNRPDTDLILRSSDQTDFRVHRAILEMASSFFADGCDAFDKRNTGMTSLEDGCLPVCHIDADGPTINLILRHIYPLTIPKVQDIDDALTAVQVSQQYGFRLVTNAMKQTIIRLAEANPLKVFARAALRRREDEMRLSARLSLRYPILEGYVPDLEELSAGTYYRLLVYHRQCGRVAAAAVDDLEWMEGLCGEGNSSLPAFFTCRLCPSFNITPAAIRSKEINVTSWFHALLLTFKQALRARPCGSTMYNDELTGPAMSEAMTCLVCRTSALRDCKRTVEILRETVNRAISLKVCNSIAVT
ncbi:hypothetical protein EIP91_011638 [Steccherinum ochraceum]|uniref:BTB domain-containing protein n=1 Tax=Steccherinum ochraceum TaxID=92696 RepID=A0A4V2MWY5_9APHY|nr:hypothetical protein EIP91_011638 [Steccherinum ochraceum]